MLREMAAVAVECIKKPGRFSVWSEAHGRYVCSDEPIFQSVVAQHAMRTTPAHPSLNPAFKIVFLTAAGGTLLFVFICVTLTILAGKEMPEPTTKLVTGLFDLAKIGFGAVVGLLGGQVLRESQAPGSGRG